MRGLPAHRAMAPVTGLTLAPIQDRYIVNASARAGTAPGPPSPARPWGCAAPAAGPRSWSDPFRPSRVSDAPGLPTAWGSKAGTASPGGSEPGRGKRGVRPERHDRREAEKKSEHRQECLCHLPASPVFAVWHSAASPQIEEDQKAKGKNLCAGPRAGLGRNLQGRAAIKTIVNDSIVNDSILERRRKLATSRNLRGVRRNGTLVVQTFELARSDRPPKAMKNRLRRILRLASWFQKL